MSEGQITLSLEERSVQGKAVRQLRRDGMVPAVIHDHGQPSKVVMVPFIEISKVYAQAGKHHLLELSLDGQKYTAIIKDIRFDPKKHQMQHVVFNAIKQDQKIETEVPVHIEGDIPAEKAGLILVRTLDSISIEALPKDLIDEVKISAATLVEIGDKITVMDLAVPAGVEILTEPEHTIAVVEEPRVIEEEVPEEPVEGEEGAEGGEEVAEGEEGAEGASDSEESKKE